MEILSNALKLALLCIAVTLLPVACEQQTDLLTFHKDPNVSNIVDTPQHGDTPIIVYEDKIPKLGLENGDRTILDEENARVYVSLSAQETVAIRLINDFDYDIGSIEWLLNHLPRETEDDAYFIICTQTPPFDKIGGPHQLTVWGLINGEPWETKAPVLIWVVQ